MPDAHALTQGDFERLLEGGSERSRSEDDASPQSEEEQAPAPDDIAHEPGDVTIDIAKQSRHGLQQEGPPPKPARKVGSGIARKRGKAPGLTPGVMAQIGFAIRYGASISQAAVAAGVHRRTLLKWLERGEREAAGPYAGLSRRVMLARRERIVPAPIEKIISVFQDGHEKRRSILSRSDLTRLCEVSAVRYAPGHHIGGEPSLVEIRWPKPRSRLTPRQAELFRAGLMISASDADRRHRFVSLIGNAPTH
jgi:hypothetical protein